MVNSTSAGVAGYKTQPNWNFSNDYWIVKFCEMLQAGWSAPSFICPGSCIDFVNLSIQATSFQWYFPGALPDTSTSINPVNICYSSPGTYDVQLIATNANGSDTLLMPNYITVYPTPVPQGITQIGDTLFANAGASVYQWYFNGNVIPSATEYFYVADASGDYNVVATDNNGCEVEAVINDVIAAVPPLSLGEGPGVRLYPNPVKDKCIIHNAQCMMGTACQITIYNVFGDKIYSAANKEPLIVDCKYFPSGMYYLEINSGEKIYRTKFLKH
jgi:hypothetical protein